MYRTVRHKCFVSYHSADADAVRAFVHRFDTGEDRFIHRAITMPEDIVRSENDDYIMKRIREQFLADSTVTLVMIGPCTWSRRFIDWEVQVSLRQPEVGSPNGLLAVLLDPQAKVGTLPNRVKLNVDSGYAKFYPFPGSGASLSSWIHDAWGARTTLTAKIVNPRERQRHDFTCT